MATAITPAAANTIARQPVSLSRTVLTPMGHDEPDKYEDAGQRQYDFDAQPEVALLG